MKTVITSIINLSSQRPIATATALIALLLLLFGGILSGSDDKAENTADFPVNIKVESRQAELHRRMIVVYGSTQPVRDVNLNAQTQGAVMAIPAKEGMMLKKGDVILEVDVRDRQARYSQAKALLKQREIEYEAARKLNRGGFQSEISLAQAKTQLEDARANLKRLELDLEFSKLTAPFDGRLDRVNVEVGDFVGIGTFGVEGATARLIDTDPMLAIAEVTEKDRPYLSIGLEADVKLGIGMQREGVVSYLGYVADDFSRTFRVEVELSNPNDAIPAGVTAELHIPGKEALAYHVKPSMLALDDEGRVGIKRLDANNTVVFEPVEMIEDSPEGMWVMGPPDEIRLVTVGQAYLSAGLTVPADAIQEESNE